MILLAIFYFVFPKALADEVNYIYKVIDIVDGDTIIIDTKQESKLVNKLGLRVRIYGIDTPEKKGKCQKEKDLALQAKEFTKNLIDQKQVILKDVKWDKFGGRIDAKVFLNDLNIGQELIKNGLAIEYFGERKNKNWCI